MSSSEIAIRVEGLGKRYEIYDAPHDRLKQFFIPRLRRFSGLGPRNFYREHWALKDVSFEVRKGESIGIVGANGSGKSTLLQLIVGTLSATTGLVETQGRIAALLELGSGFNPDYTGRENAYLNGALLGLSREEMDELMPEIGKFAGIGDFFDQPVKQYSSGMVVRVAFAVQAQVNPDILIVDEALAVGDALFQKRCFERIDKLRSNGTTLLFVSHDQESIRTITDRAVLLNHGEVLTIGRSSEVILEYRKLLHEEETRILNETAERLKEKAAEERKSRNRQVLIANVTNSSTPTRVDMPSTASAGLGTMSFGDMEAEVLNVRVLNDKDEQCSHFDPRDTIRIVVECVSHHNLDHLNVSLRIRNKEGVKIYSWGTLNQDMAILAGIMDGEIFWKKRFAEGKCFSVEFDFICGLGPNLYEIQAAVTSEGKPYYAEQRMLHWIDEAAFFSVTIDPRAYAFGGVVDLRMTSRLQGICE